MRKTIMFLLILSFLSLLCFGEPNNISEELFNAVYFKDSDVIVELDKIKELLRKGANPNWVYGGTISILNWHVQLVSDCEDPNTFKKGVEAIKLLFNNGAKIQSSDKSILFWPISENKPKIVEMLLKNGASAIAILEKAQPIDWAAHYGSEDVYNLLIEHGAKPLSESEKALYHFIYLAGAPGQNRVHKMEKLRPQFTFIDAENFQGEAALTEAATGAALALYDFEDYKVITYLLEKKANPNSLHLCNYVKQPALHVAVERTSRAFNKKLEDVKSDFVREDIKISKHYGKLIIEELLKGGAHISGRDEFKRTPLHIAAKYNNVIAAEILIKTGAKLMDKDKDGKSPLDYAESAEMIKLLKDVGAKEIP